MSASKPKKIAEGYLKLEEVWPRLKRRLWRQIDSSNICVTRLDDIVRRHAPFHQDGWLEELIEA